MRTAIKDVARLGKPVIAPPLEEEQAPDLEEEPDPGPPLIPTILDRNYLEWKRCIVHTGDLNCIIKVIFYHCSSGSEIQRSYANCLNCSAHGDCVRWKSCNLFQHRDDLAAYMYAWATGGQHLESRELHMTYEPPDALVADVAGRMTIVEF